eukprot:c17483_g1_i1.p1 GENE.c17483_g1_i1~~c17483_g1_i1.p1  ORF type:complete len:202 (-),score=39.31 c17483_g1_i1:18-623(-)
MFVARAVTRTAFRSTAVRQLSIARFFDKVVTESHVATPGRVYTSYGSFDEYGHKTSTNIVGITVEPNARQVIQDQAREILEEVSRGIPETAQYRINVERTYRFRLKCAQQIEDIAQLEEAIRAGQAEELIAQGQNELKLIREMRKWRPWETTPEELKEHIEGADYVRQTLRNRACEHTEVFLGKPMKVTTFEGKQAVTESK